MKCLATVHFSALGSSELTTGDCYDAETCGKIRLADQGHWIAVWEN